MDYDIIIIGAGPAGLTASIYAARAGYSAAIIENMMPGGQVVTTSEIENYPGFLNISGYELIDNMMKQVQSYNVKVVSEKITDMQINDKVKIINTNKNSYKAKTVIIASGSKRKILDVEGEAAYRGNGVSYCAMCDGNLYRKKDVAVIGGGNSAIDDALYLSRICGKVYLIHRRDKFRAKGINVDRILNRDNIIPIMTSAVSAINGETSVTSIDVKNLDTNEIGRYDVNAVFIAIGTTPSSDYIPLIIKRDDDGYIITDENMMTNINGVYAAGDVRHSPLKQIVTATSDGAIAASKAIELIGEQDL